jgi:hypothetical protein
MGGYAQCWLGGLYVGSSKNDVDHGIMQLFRPSDKRTLPARNVDLPSQLKDWTDDLEDDDAKPASSPSWNRRERLSSDFFLIAERPPPIRTNGVTSA